MTERAAALLEAGGPVAYVLIASSIVLFFVAALRCMDLLVGPRDAERLRHAIARAESVRGLLHSLVTTAPLLGLLGTVGGMIETFASLRGQGGIALTHATEQTVAGGISVALVTTQLGLLVGIPGLVVARLLDRLELRRRHSLRRLEWADRAPPGGGR